MNEQETTTDIIAKMDRVEVCADGEPCLRDYARRFEAAHKRERGDCAKLREALKLCVDEMCNRCRNLASARGNPLPCLQGCEPVRKAKAALAAPPRNCDVGAVREQLVRYTKFCYAHRSHEKGCGGCQLNGEPCCELAWAQMHYEEGGSK